MNIHKKENNLGKSQFSGSRLGQNVTGSISSLDEQKVLSRYYRPNKYDHAVKGTKLFVFTTKELYQQVGSNWEEPQWIVMDSPLIKKHCFLDRFE